MLIKRLYCKKGDCYHLSIFCFCFDYGENQLLGPGMAEIHNPFDKMFTKSLRSFIGSPFMALAKNYTLNDSTPASIML